MAMKRADASEGRWLRGLRYVLLKSPEKLSEQGASRLKKLRDCNHNLNTAYVLKEQFRAIFRSTTPDAATLSLAQWVKMATASGIGALKRFAGRIATASREVLNALHSGIHSAAIESMNATIQRILSKTCGVSDMDYLFSKLRQRYLMQKKMKLHDLFRGRRVRTKTSLFLPGSSPPFSQHF